MESQSCTCPNPICGKTFAKPLKVENLSYGNLVIYEGCPYCLTEIAIKDGVPMGEAKLEHEQKPEKITVAQKFSAETPGCRHYLGYLSERSSRENIPEECMVCPKIVQCMLKGVTS
ncbi:MAG: hypothetical protein QXZ68_00820 [Candidatus Bathyarchaeia archaeon]